MVLGSSSFNIMSDCPTLHSRWQESSIFSNSSHLEWRAAMSNIILKVTHTRTILARFGLIWLSGFRGDDLNVKVYVQQ
jgi:hypothetical protein